MFILLSKQIKTAPEIIANDYTQKERMKQIYTDSSFIYPARRNGIKELRVFESKSDFTKGHGETQRRQRKIQRRHREVRGEIRRGNNEYAE